MHTLDINVMCPGCKRTNVRVRHDDGSDTTICKTKSCLYYEVHFKLPVLELETTEEGKQILEERRISNREW